MQTVYGSTAISFLLSLVLGVLLTTIYPTETCFFTTIPLLAIVSSSLVNGGFFAIRRCGGRIGIFSGSIVTAIVLLVARGYLRMKGWPNLGSIITYQMIVIGFVSTLCLNNKNFTLE